MVRSFYIDAYPVTNDRYRECVDAGVCIRPSSGHPYHDPRYAGVTFIGYGRFEAGQFCRWDGGRRLPTEAEWEKAVRGPAPRRNPYPWDGDEYRCDLVNDFECQGLTGRIARPTIPWDHEDALGTRSYYGTYLQYGNTLEWVSDDYDGYYYADDSSLIDPTGPDTTIELARGAYRDAPRRELALRTPEPGHRAGFRCARDASP